jgi:hypothetical protein
MAAMLIAKAGLRAELVLYLSCLRAALLSLDGFLPHLGDGEMG